MNKIVLVFAFLSLLALDMALAQVPIPTKKPVQTKPAQNKAPSHDWQFAPQFSIGFPYIQDFGMLVVSPTSRYLFEFNQSAYRGTFSGNSINTQSQEAAFKIKNTSTPFFFAVALGQLNAISQKSQAINQIEIEQKIKLTASYLKLGVGWLWANKSGGLFFSAELGAQIPFGGKVDYSTNAPVEIKQLDDYKQVEKEVSDLGNLITKTPLPTATLLKIGWLF